MGFRVLSAILILIALTSAYSNRGWAADDKSPIPTTEALVDGKVARDGFDLQYQVFGDKGPFLVVLAGGPGADPRYMTPVVNELSTKFRCVLVEQRGTGRSKLKTYDAKTINFGAYLEDVEALRKQLGDDRLLLIGHSWGAMLALSYAGTHPDRVKGIVSLCSGPTAEEHAEAEEVNVRRRLLPKQLEAIEALEKRRDKEPAQTFLEVQKIMFSAYFWDPAKADFPGVNAEVMMLGYDPGFGSLDNYIRSRLSAIQAPVLIIHGRQDAVTEGSAVEAHYLIKGSRLKLINKSGHVPWVEQPEELWKAVHDFMEPFWKSARP
jgi:proline iminopeptidase